MQNTACIKRNFLTLLVAYFAIEPAMSILGFIAECGWLPSVNIMPQWETPLSLTNVIITILTTVLYLMILIRLLVRKEYMLKVKSKIGLTLLIVQQFQGYILYALSPESSFLAAMIQVAFTVVYITGLFLFIDGSPADRNLKKFVKWSPFIKLMFAFAFSIISSATGNFQMIFSIGYNLAFIAMSLAIFMIVYRMACNSLKTD